MVLNMIETVKAKLENQLKDAESVNKYAKAIAKPCMNALISFCEQDEEFASAVLDGNFARCGNAVTPQVPTALVRANLPEECV